MKKILQILERKGKSVLQILPSTTVQEALIIMAEKNIGSLAVVEGDKFHGIVTERDYARKVMLKGKNSASTPVSEIMTTDFPLLTDNDTVDKCMQLLTENNLRYLPVMHDNKIVGLISVMDVVQETILTQQETISELHQYITGSNY